jgi:diguanylate cyclase (GGDEF)-like protein/PAS domain S-box-containing protein
MDDPQTPPGHDVANQATTTPSVGSAGWTAGSAAEIDRWSAGIVFDSSAHDLDLGTAMLDGLGRVVLLNASFERATGLDGDDVLGRSILDVLPSSDRVDLASVLAQVRTTASAVISVQRDGQSVEVLVTSLPGEPSRFAAHIYETAGAERRRAMSETDRGFELSFEQLAVGMSITGLDGRITRSNTALAEMVGAELVPGMLGLDLLHPDEHQDVIQCGLAELTGEGGGWRVERRLQRADGTTMWVLECCSLVRNDQGDPLHFLSQYIDISERKAAEEALVESQRRANFLADGLPIAVVEVGAEGVILAGNQALFELVDRNVVGEPLDSIVHPDDFDGLVAAFRARGYRDSVLEFRIRRRDFVERWVRAHIRVKTDTTGAILGSLATWTDITDEFEARAMSSQFGEVIETIEDMLAITDADGGLIYLNFAGRMLLGDEEMPLDGLNLADIFEAKSSADVRDVALSTARNFGSWKGEVAVISLSFERQVLQLSIASHVSDAGEIYLSAMTRDITELKRAEDNLRQQATTDALTGLPNRVILFDRLGHELARTARSDGGLALLFVDLDRFKTVNDTMGHEAGDELLIQVAQRLQTCVRGSDTVARIGGDEFVILAEPVVRVDDARIIGERMVRAISEPFELSGGIAQIGASIGLAMGDKRSTPRGLLKQADLAAYQAKAGGRSCLVVADS